MRITPLIACLFITFCVRLCAQNNQYRFSRIDIAQGLSNNEVNCIFKDEKGFMWFGTRSGLNRYDGYKFKVFKHDLSDSNSISDGEVDHIFDGPEHKLWISTKSGLVTFDLLTEKFDNHPQNFLKSAGIPDDNIIDIKKNEAGFYWFLSSSSGLYKYNAQGKTARKIASDIVETAAGARTPISGFAINKAGNMWVAGSDGTLQQLDPSTGRVLFSTDALRQVSPGSTLGYSMYVDADNDLWLYSAFSPAGLFYYNVPTGQVQHLVTGSAPKNLNNDVIKGVVQDGDGLVWIATDHGGINLLNKKDFTITYLLNHDDDAHSIAQNCVYALYLDNSGIIWAGTYKRGVCYYHKDIIKFPLFCHKPSDPASLPYNDINRFVEDAKGNLWIATNGGGLLYLDRQTGKYTRYMHDPANSNSLCNNVIVSLCLDHEQKLWIGTYFGGLDCFDGRNFTHYQHNDGDVTSIADNSIWSILEDSQQRLWIGTFAHGLDRYDRATNRFVHYKPTGYHSVHCAYVCGLVQATNGDIWVGTSSGIDVIQKGTENFIHYYEHDNAHPTTSLSSNNTIAIMQDSRGLIWVTTRDGLDYFDPATGVFTTLRREDGLPDNIILSVVEDLQHNIWVSTPNGIANLIVHKNAQTGRLNFQCRNYNEPDGLQGREFNEYAGYALRDGQLIFGGANGYNLFSPAKLSNMNYAPVLVLTDLQMFNKSLSAGEELNGHIILPQSISETKKIAFKYYENVFSIEFAALNFFNTSKIRYAYTLQNFNNEWFIADDKTHKATYTNLDPGNYVFRVRMVNENATWSKETLALAITILPPFWKTPLAYIIYVLLIAGCLYVARRMVLNRAREAFAIEQERMEAHRQHELNMLKIRFFTNLSHDLRTPLSLIIAPLDKIIKNAPDAVQKHQFQMIHRNARRLLNLVNQLLDFRKMEMQELKLNTTKGDIVTFIKNISYSFTDLAEKKNIEFCYNASLTHLVTVFDHDKVERMLFNLLSNAFKFTPEHGNVSVDVNASKRGDTTLLQIKVRDTGIGIPPEKHEKIFERFFQNEVPGNMVNQGSGIGLAITKEFLKLLDGSISVESVVNQGSCFTLLLPVKEVATLTPQNGLDNGKAGENDVLEEEPDSIEPITADTNGALEKTDNKAGKKPVILLVEDNEDLRFYLKDNLKQYFNIVEAANGKVGWQKALSAHPNLIVSDINMPEMNGIDLCRKIKSDKRTAFVPVILLTALTGEEEQLKGLETGAGDYITKPFNFEILLSKIRNLLAQQETTKRSYQKHVAAGPSEINVGSPDEKFMQRVLEVIEKNISNPDFSVEELSREMYMSRVALYKKILALTFKTPVEFIRSMRLKRAAQLLEKSRLSVAEIAYEVGFNNPKYFAKFFKAEFDILPSAYQAGKRKQQAAAAVKQESYDEVTEQHP